MSTTLACGSAAWAVACTAGESGSGYFWADAKQGTSNKKNSSCKLRVAITPPQPEPAFRTYSSAMGTSSNGLVTGIMRLIFFTSAGGAGYFAHHRKVFPGAKLASLLELLLDKTVPSVSLSTKYFLFPAVT